MDITLLRTFSTTRRIKTGAWSRFQPVFISSLSPCMEACPLGIDIPKLYWLYQQKGTKEAYFHLLRFNPFASITGRVCPHFCEEKCNRAQFDEPVAIRALEKYIGDKLFAENIFPSKEDWVGKRVAVIGSGPSGLMCAWELAVWGFEVVIFERESVAGGILAWGIPDFRLGKDVVYSAVRRLEEMGVRIETGVEIKPSDVEALIKEFDEVVVATGLQKPKRLQIKNSQYALLGLEVLKKYNMEGVLPEGETVVVIGGGNVAVDVARVFSKRGRKVFLVCVEPENEMPAIKEEIEDAKIEGVEIIPSTGVEEIIVKDGKIKGVRVGKVRIIGEEDRFKKVEFIEQPKNVIECQLVVFSVGQESEFSWSSQVWLAGDLAIGPSTVAQAMATGRDVAFAIRKKYKAESESNARWNLWERDKFETVTFEELNPWYFKKSPRNEVFDEESVLLEMERCFSCGYCNVCGNCWIFCPDVAISLEEKPILDADHCKGCGICAMECPRAVISMKLKI